jgi:DNA-binding transcriptional ArsR family regulator
VLGDWLLGLSLGLDGHLFDFARAVADRTRREIMTLCCCDWRSVGELADQLHVTQPTVSHHLAFLRDANLVLIRPQGRQTFYTLNQREVAACCEGAPSSP